MVSFPFCKINLGLQILNRRPDGYHSISTCFFPVRWTDVLEILPSDKLSFTQTGMVIPGPSDDNLTVKAFNLLKEDFNLPGAGIHLHKIIPMGAGLGGGSSDAAFTLKMLNEIFDLKISEADLMQYAARLGSDCAYFIQNGAMLGTGRGEVLSEIKVDLTGLTLVIVVPKIHVSTAEAYSGVVPSVPDHSIPEILRLPVEQWKGRLVNDFEKSVFKKFPQIEEVKQLLYSEGALYASMSGSGSSVFGIFRNDINPALPGDLTQWSCRL